MNSEQSQLRLENYSTIADASADQISSDSNSETLLVAYASMDGECVDQHFGSAQAFYVYALSANSERLIAIKHFEKTLKDGNEDKLKPKMEFLQGGDLVYCGSIGGSAVRQLVALGISPVQLKEGPEIQELIEELQKELSGTPSTLIQRIIQKKSETGETNEFEEEWED